MDLLPSADTISDTGSPNTAHCHTVRCFNSLDNLSEEIAALLKTAESRSFDLGLDWFKLLSNTTFGRNDIIKFYVVTNFLSEPVLALPLQSSHDSRRLDALANFYSSLFAPAVSQGDFASALVDCFAAIRHEKPAWTSLKLQPLAHDSGEYRQLMLALRQAGWMTFEY